MKMFTSWTSDLPSRSALEISQVPPDEALSTPNTCDYLSFIRNRTFCSSNLESHLFANVLEILSRGEKWNLRCNLIYLWNSFGLITLTIEPARRPVPKLDGQVKIQPRCSECMNSTPSSLRTSFRAEVIFANRLKIEVTI